MKRSRQHGGGLVLVSIGTAGGLGVLLLLVCLASILLPPAAAGRAPALLVLGAAQYNGRPSPAFRARLEAAAALYRAGGVERVVVTGGVGAGDRLAEGDVGRAFLLERGVPARAVVGETRSRSTVENLRFARPLVGDRPVTLVTDSVHAPRALALARAEGLRAGVAPVAVRGSGAGFWAYALREALLTAGYALVGPGR